MNAIAVVDKPGGLTSHDVVARIRRIYNIRRVGHAGTLDPIATGVLPVFLGRATRACEFAAADNKVYSARLLLGVSTDTQDITGEIISKKPVDVSRDEVESAARRFLGEIRQIPPMYSAIKVNGQKLYELARQGVEIKREPRSVKIHEISVSRVDEARYDLTVSCSKGTYIRALCADIGDALGCGGTMEALRRIRSGVFGIEQARTLERISENPRTDCYRWIIYSVNIRALRLMKYSKKRRETAHPCRLTRSPAKHTGFIRKKASFLCSPVARKTILKP